jgi:type I restriction enzyme S subunit
LTVALPPLPEQRSIARVLGGLDEKIELNRRMNRTLEDMARALFNDWLERMESELETVTTQSLTDSGVLVIGDGYRAKRSELRPKGLPFARAGNIDGGFRFTDCEYMGVDGVQAAGVKVSRPLDSVFTSKGTVGRLALVSKSTPTFVYAPQLCFWRAADPSRLNPFVLHQWMHGDEFGEQVDMTKGQTDMADYVSLTDQRRMRITLPSPKRQAEVGRHLERLYGMMDQNTTQIGTLAALRDSLLPVLLSGELRLHHVSAAVKEVVA